MRLPDVEPKRIAKSAGRLAFKFGGPVVGFIGGLNAPDQISPAYAAPYRCNSSYYLSAEYYTDLNGDGVYSGSQEETGRIVPRAEFIVTPAKGAPVSIILQKKYSDLLRASGECNDSGQLDLTIVGKTQDGISGSEKVTLVDARVDPSPLLVRTFFKENKGTATKPGQPATGAAAATPKPENAPIVVTATPTQAERVITATPVPTERVVTATPTITPFVVTATPTATPRVEVVEVPRDETPWGRYALIAGLGAAAFWRLRKLFP